MEMGTPPRMKTRLAPVACLLVIVFAPFPAGAEVLPRNLALDRSRTDAVEDLSDSLTGAVDALASAMSHRDRSSIGSFLDERMTAAPFPSAAGPVTPDVKWLQSHGWRLPETPSGSPGGGSGGGRPETVVVRALGREQFLDSLDAFLSHFTAIEDLHLDVASADFADPERASGEAALALELIGKDPDGRLEWTRGRFDVAVERHDGQWRILRWRTESLHSELSARQLFTDVGAKAGLDGTFPPFGTPPNDGFLSQGAAVGDVNGDGLMDLLVTGMHGAMLYLNDGEGGFRDISGSAGLSGIPRATAAVFLDYDQDGDSDIFLSAVGKQMLLENTVDPNGVLRFVDVSEKSRVAVDGAGVGAVVADVNGDGLPDVYVVAANRFGQVMPNSWLKATNGTPNLLFVNAGSGRFREAAHEWRVDDPRWSYGAAFADVNGDGWEDLYVANRFGDNALYVNKRTHFENEAALRGVSGPGFATSVSWGDYDDDGDLDLAVTGVSSSVASRILSRLSPGSEVLDRLVAGDALYRNRGSGWFDDVTREAGPFPAGWSWGGGFVDFDNDGWDDLLSVSGFVTGTGDQDTESLFWRHVIFSSAELERPGNEEWHDRQMKALYTDHLSLAGHQRDRLFMNLGKDGFRDISGLSGIDAPGDGRSLLFADFDNDGDLDVVTTEAQNQALHLYRNDAGQEGGFLRVTLVGTRSGKDAYGAVVRLKTSRGIQTRIKTGGSGFASQSDPRLLFGLGGDETAEWLEVTWPSGLKQRAAGIRAGDSLKITEDSKATERVQERRFRLGGAP